MTVRILEGDCRDVLRTLPDASVHSIVTDPPYELTSARPGGRSESTRGKVMGGFMGMAWDGSGVAFDVAVWVECLRVLRPGGHLLSFGGSRTYHRMACAIEDAGFEIRDQIMYLYGSGFPKSYNLDRERGNAFCGCEASDDSVRGMRRASHDAGGMVSESKNADLQQAMQRQAALFDDGAAPEHERRKEGAESESTGAEQPSLEGRHHTQAPEGELHRGPLRQSAGLGDADGKSGRLHHGASPCDGADVRVPSDADGGCRSSGSQPIEQQSGEPCAVSDERGSQARGSWPVCDGCGKPIIPSGYGTALKPAHEPIVVARKPLIGTVAANVLAHGTGALNIDGCRVGDDPITQHGRSDSANSSMAGRNYAEPSGRAWTGRWPANVIHDGSDQVLALFPAQAGQQSAVRGTEPSECHSGVYSGPRTRQAFGGRGDSGSAARFFYCAKASKEDREIGCEGLPTKRGGMVSNTSGQHITRRDGGDPGERANHHPTVKPTDLMRYLVRLVTPPGGTVLDPFAGSGSTGRAADIEGFDAILIELSPEYAAIARRRVNGDSPLFASVA